MNLLPLLDILEGKKLGKKGVSLFVNMLPAACKNGIVLRGRSVGDKIDHELPGYYKSHFQLIVRSKDYQVGQELIDDAVTALTMNERQLSEYFIKYMRPANLPVVFPLSNGDYFEFSVQMDFCINV